jgi:hypothetical protein
MSQIAQQAVHLTMDMEPALSLKVPGQRRRENP